MTLQSMCYCNDSSALMNPFVAAPTNATLSAWGHPTDAAQTQLYNALGQLARSTAFSTPTYDWGGTTSYAYDTRPTRAREQQSRR